MNGAAPVMMVLSMRTNMRRFFHDMVCVGLLALLPSGAGVSAAGTNAAKAKAEVDLVASVAEVVPGRPFDVAVRFRIAAAKNSPSLHK